MNLIHHNKRDKYYYTKKYNAEKEFLNKKSPKQNKTNYKPFLKILLIVIILFGVGYLLSKNNDKAFLEDSNEVNAIITNIKYNNRLVNQMDGERIKNYVFEYSYKVENDIINSFYQIDEYNYTNYFDKYIEVGDTIIVLYKKNNSEVTKIKKR